MKRLTVILLCLALLFSFAACADRSEAAEPQLPAEKGKASSETPEASIPTAEKAKEDTASAASEEAAEDTAAESPETDVSEADGDSEKKKTDDAAPAAPSPDESISLLEQTYAGLTEDALSWEYDGESRTLTVSGEGPMKDYLTDEPEWFAFFGEAEKIVIGDQVSSVGAGAFMSFSAVGSVSLGASVEFIGNAAFHFCTELRTVNFPDSLKYVGSYAFNDTLLHSESGFVFPEGLLYLGDSAFYSALKESFVSLPASLTRMEPSAFRNCFIDEFRVDPANPSYCSENGILYDKDLQTLICYPARKTDSLYELPGSVTAILSEAIGTTNSLEKIVIPASVTTIEEGAIYWNYALRGIEVDGNNPSYASVDGVLFTKDGKLLLCYPIADGRSEYSVPDGCERIGAYAMSQAAGLSSVYANEGLKEIGRYGFYLCGGLSELALPGSLTEIGDSAFLFCDALSEIAYSGTAGGWSRILIGENNGPLSDGSVSPDFIG